MQVNLATVPKLVRKRLFRDPWLGSECFIQGTLDLEIRFIPWASFEALLYPSMNLRAPIARIVALSARICDRTLCKSIQTLSLS